MRRPMSLIVAVLLVVAGYSSTGGTDVSSDAKEKATKTACVMESRTLDTAIAAHEVLEGTPPASDQDLVDVGLSAPGTYYTLAGGDRPVLTLTAAGREAGCPAR